MGEATASSPSIFAVVLAGGRGERFWYAVKPDKVYHLGTQSHVRVNFELPDYH